MNLRIFLFYCALVGTAAGGPLANQQIENIKSLPDRTEELRKILDNSRPISPGIYRVTSPLEFQLGGRNSVLFKPDAGRVTIVMDGPGPALRLVGSHQGSADPKTFKPETWNERMPVIEGIEIIGNHPEADGIELDGCVQPIVSKVAIRWCRHGIHLVNRNRNVTISDCHLYENSGIGLFLDDVNLHQINVSNCHISYNREGGIVVRDGNVRNLQVTGCDIEANMPGTIQPTRAANIFLDVSGSKLDKSKSIAEVAITGCTIQHSANYGKTGQHIAKGGANIRLAGKAVWPIDSVTITGNVLSDTTTSIDIDESRDITISGNAFFAPKPSNLKVTNSKRIVVTGNSFNPRQFVRPGTIHFKKSEDCIFANCIVNDFKTRDGALILEECRGIQVRGNIFSGCDSGIVLEDSHDLLIHDNLFRRLAEGADEVVKDENSSDLSID